MARYKDAISHILSQPEAERAPLIELVVVVWRIDKKVVDLDLRLRKAWNKGSGEDAREIYAARNKLKPFKKWRRRSD